MAYDPSINRGVIAPVLHTVDPGPQALASPPPLPPFALTSVGYVVPVPVASFHNPNFRSPFYSESFLPPRVALDQSVLAQMDDYRAQFLLQVMESEGLVPSPEEEMKRKKVIKELKQIVLSWIRKVAWQRHLPKDIIAKTNATVLTYGSYGLGVHGPESDIDALCVGPYFASIEDDFFTVLHGLLQSRPEVSELHCVKTAKVPLMRFKFNGISIDFPYAHLRVVSVPDDVNIFDPSLVIPDESQKSFSGVRVNTRILQLVPNLRNFQALLRCIKLWAKRRGVYSHLLGFFGGIHLAILATFVCQRYPTASINALMTMFFETFLHWPWPDPIILHGQSMPFKSPDERCFMPILMPCSPFDWCNSNITRSTFRKIITEFQRGYDITKDHGRLDFQWGHVFTHFPYSMCYPYFVSICLVAPDQEELQDWVGWVKSRFRSLLLKLEREFGYCDPNPNEYVDMTVGQPNVVFFWGLLSPVGDFCDLNSIKEEFVRSIISSREEHAVRKNTQQCKLEMSILEATQIPADVQINSGGEKGLKACWRNMDYYQCQHRKPLYSQYLPHYIVGYMASGADCCNIPFC